MSFQGLAIIDVGHGNSAVVADGKHVVIIDAGPKTSLLEFLSSQAITEVEAILISHADADHVEGLMAVLGSGIVAVKKVRLNSDSLKGSKLWDDVAYELDRREREKKIDFRPALTPAESKDFDFGPLRIEVLGPTSYLAQKGPGSEDRKGRRLTSNSISAVVRIVYKDIAIALLSGDVDEIGLDELIEVKTDLTAPLLVYPHHGGKSGQVHSNEFIAKLCGAVNPKLVIFSIGRGKFGTPRPEVVNAVRAAVTNARIACTQLSEHCAAQVPAQAKHLNEYFAEGKSKSHCCAGTVYLDFSNPDKPSPNVEAHSEFIQVSAPTSLCQK